MHPSSIQRYVTLVLLTVVCCALGVWGDNLTDLNETIHSDSTNMTTTNASIVENRTETPQTAPINWVTYLLIGGAILGVSTLAFTIMRKPSPPPIDPLASVKQYPLDMHMSTVQRYIRTQMNKGVQRKQVRQSLLDNGWPPELVAEELAQIDTDDTTKQQYGISGQPALSPFALEEGIGAHQETLSEIDSTPKVMFPAINKTNMPQAEQQESSSEIRQPPMVFNDSYATGQENSPSPVYPSSPAVQPSSAPSPVYPPSPAVQPISSNSQIYGSVSQPMQQYQGVSLREQVKVALENKKRKMMEQVKNKNETQSHQMNTTQTSAITQTIQHAGILALNGISIDQIRSQLNHLPDQEVKRAIAMAQYMLQVQKVIPVWRKQGHDASAIKEHLSSSRIPPILINALLKQ